MISVSGRLLATVALCALLSGCAQTGPPLPPSLELPKPPSDLRASRKGDRVTLAWSQPTRTTDRQTVRYLGPTRICRSADIDFKECGTPVGEIPPPLSANTSSATQLPSLMFTDTWPAGFQDENPTGDVTYAVEVMNRDHRAAGLSSKVTVPAVPTLPPPADFHAELTGSSVAFTWTNVAEGPSLPGVQHRYRIYRRDEATGKETIAIEIPAAQIGPPHAEDSGFEWEKSYLYRVAAVSVVARRDGDAQVEGDDSPTIRIVAHDVFPPAVPSGLQAVFSGEGQKPFVDLIWSPVTDADLAGYNVYRHESDGSVTKLNAELVKSPSYRDPAVTSGKAYFYSVSAVDLRNNESARSEEAHESVP